MADKYERWNNWAPQYIKRLMDDFKLVDFQAAAFPETLLRSLVTSILFRR
jgi:hypothetical protein